MAPSPPELRRGFVARSTRSVAVSAAIAVAMLVGGASPVGARSTAPSLTGNDISFPQCGRTFPSGQAFGIVGVTGGLANTPNPCLGTYNGGPPSTSELVWASKSPGTASLPPAALYANTADPGPTVADWPKNSVDPKGVDQSQADPFGACTVGSNSVGSDSQACAWQYGWNRAVQDVVWLGAAASQVRVSGTATYPWWLDVETANSWETGPGLANNVADLEGMVAALKASGVATGIGIYSTSYQWGQITGGSNASTLKGLPVWIPGARTASAAQSNCALPGFTTGPVAITQWFGKPFDGDVACL
jgi:hypothetical protein